MTIFGVHTGLQNTSVGELVPLWRRIESLGYRWISIWDHFYAATLGEGADCLEGVSLHAALACTTRTVTCGSLVYSVGYRHPAVLAKAVTAIDHLSSGRAAIGLGAGWSQVEYDAYGIPFPAPKTRLDQLEEAAACVRGLLRDETTTFGGTWFTLTDARNEPRPVQDALPVWIGGAGERRTLRIAARFADGWNVPFIDPATFAHKCGVLDRHCNDVRRDPVTIRRAVNLGLAWDDESLRAQFGNMAEFVRPGVLTGSDQQVADRVGEYVAAGAGQVNIAVRAPFERTGDDLERLAALLITE